MSGAGKTQASRIFAERGFFVINCDKQAKITLEKPQCTNGIKAMFPNVNNKTELTYTVFSDKEKLKKYENFVFPYIIFDIINLIITCEKTDILLDAPTLFQSGADDLCRKIVAIIAEKETVITRITKRDNVPEELALLRLNSQPNADFFRKNADYIIENNMSIKKLEKHTNEVIDGLI